MKLLLQVTIEAHDFATADFIGGDAALDFINTVTGRDETPRDWIDSYDRLLGWARLAQLLPERNLRVLARRTRSEPAAAARALARAKVLRESLFALSSSIAAGNRPPPHSIELLREQWLAGTAAHELHFVDGRVAAQLRADAADLDLIGWLVAYRLVEHVMPLPTDRLRLCHGSNCSWVFIDSSKAGRRRWCDMAVCGNVAKSRRFQARAQRQRGKR